MQREAQSQADKIRGNESLSTTQRAAMLEAIRNETTSSIGAMLGARAFSAYQNNGGDWINDLSAPRP